MKRLLSLVLLLQCFVFVSGVHAQADHLKTFPALTLDGAHASAFKDSATTNELYKKYHGLARMVKTGDIAAQKRIIQANLANDLTYWKAEANRPFTAPKAPNTKDKKAREKFDEKLAKAEAAEAKKKSFAQAYVNWLEREIPAWLKSIE